MIHFSLISATLFTIASIFLIQNIRHQQVFQDNPSKQIFLISLAAEILFIISISSSTLQPNGINFSFFNIAALVACILVLLYLITFFTKPVEVLGLIILPLAAIIQIIHLFFPDIIKISTTSLSLQVHILLSLLAYSLLSVSALQAILLFIQNKLLKERKTAGFIRSLPPFFSMELLLFKIILVGFILLSLSLFSGFIFLEDIFAQHLVHKTVLSIIAWVIYGVLLWGHYQFGWRGKKSITLTLSAFTFLMLAYFGSKFVAELILKI
ncbi:MAG: cytochrome c biogenesis protein CcsA [Gammaproteobacteria bacterium]|nr:cytochrome c biogenesis protein CcsA [Gammaproteobacteria bacterium]